jgi:hypothetical protein
MQKPLAFLHTNSELPAKEIEKTIWLTIAAKSSTKISAIKLQNICERN